MEKKNLKKSISADSFSTVRFFFSFFFSALLSQVLIHKIKREIWFCCIANYPNTACCKPIALCFGHSSVIDNLLWALVAAGFLELCVVVTGWICPSAASSGPLCLAHLGCHSPKRLFQLVLVMHWHTSKKERKPPGPRNRSAKLACLPYFTGQSKSFIG